MQFSIPLLETWDFDEIDKNLDQLRSQIKWKNFKLSYNPERLETKGYFVIHFSYDEPERKSSILIYRNKVQLNYKNWKEGLLSTIILSFLLKEGNKNIFLDNLIREFNKTGELNKQFQKIWLGNMVSQYLDLVDGNVPKELLQDTKKMVQLNLKLMLQVVEEIQ